MDRQKAKILYDSLKSSSSEKVLRGLREIKKRLLTNTDNLGIFRKLGLLPQVLKFVQRPNEDILNLALSILSVACTDEAARAEVYEVEGVVHLLNVLKCAKCESLQVRACRTLANQAVHKLSSQLLVRHGVITLVLDMLNNAEQDDTKLAAIRALRLLASCGEHCQKIVEKKGILQACTVGLGTALCPTTTNLQRTAIKAVAHFSRVSHPACISQIMDGTDNMMLVTKLVDGGDSEVYESVVRMVLNMVQCCFEPSSHRRDQLDSRVIDRLCTAKAPTIIVAELQARRVTGVEEDKLILALCKFCAGTSLLNNMTNWSITQLPLFEGRAWMQLIECGGVALLVSLLIKHRYHTKLRPAILQAMLGVEHNYSYRDTILKHLLAAELLPQLAEQFDELIGKYKEVRRESQPGACVHTFKTKPSADGEAKETKKKNDPESKEKSPGDAQKNLMKVIGVLNQGEKITDSDKESGDASKKEESVFSLKKSSQLHNTKESRREEDSTSSDVSRNKGLIQANSSKSTENNSVSFNKVSGESKTSPVTSGNSLSCSPHSLQSDSSHGSPTWSPAVDRSELSSSDQGNSSFSNPLDLILWGAELTCGSSPTSPYASPPHSPCLPSPPRSTSPIRVPSDWEYDEEDDVVPMDEDGRFSPSILDKMAEGDDQKDDASDVNDDVVSEDDSRCSFPSVSQHGTEDTEAVSGVFMEEMDEKLVITGAKRTQDSEELSPDKRFKPDENVVVDGDQDAQASLAGQEDAAERSTDADDEAVTSAEKSPFIKLNQIKFLVRKRGKARRRTSLPSSDAYSPLKVTQEDPQQQQPGHRLRRQSSSSVCSTSLYSELTEDEAHWLELLDLVVRLISQVAHVVEAVNPICREFVPRIIDYLSTAQVIHKSATRMLVTIAKNSLCIQPLLDTLFIPFVGVELGEAGDPESPSGCPECRTLSQGSTAFLDQMVNFFNHVHMYGQCEAHSRLHPSRDHAMREGCVMALPHITRCPKLLHEFMICYPSLDLMMNVLQSDLSPDQARYMYATAAISRLATTLQLENKFKPIKCNVCLKKGKHSRDEVVAHFNTKKARETTATVTPDSLLPCETGAGGATTRQCKWQQDTIKDVTFTMIDGSTVSANREFLAEKNEVLKRMLMGSFCEGGQSNVDLPSSSKTSFEMLIHFLYDCRCDTLSNGNIDAYIDLVFLSQMYMLNSLQEFAKQRMLATIGAGEDVIKIYESGMGHIDENLIFQALCTVLVRPMKTWKRARWMKELFKSKHSEDIDHNIRMILHHPLDLNRLICNCKQSLSLYMASESVYKKLC